MLGKKLRKLRRDRELTQQQVADFLGLSRAAYGSYELGRRQPDNHTLLKLSRYFGVTVDYLIDDTVKNPIYL